MIRTYCDICGKEIDDSLRADFAMDDYQKTLEQKGVGYCMVSVEQVVQSKATERFNTNYLSFCPECQSKIDIAIKEMISHVD